MRKIIAILVLAVMLCPVFGATIIYNDDDGTRKVRHIEMYEETYVKLSLDYNEKRTDLANFRKPGTWYQFVYEDGTQVWLTEEEGQEMLKYLERMFGYQTW